MIGQRLGRLTILKKEGSFCTCQCDCGKVITRRTSNVRSGKTSSCGCLLADFIVSRKNTFKPIGLSLYDRWKNKIKVEDSGCWEWQGDKTRLGYGVIKHERKKLSAHRVSYILNVGPIPDGMFVLHKCDNPKCSNPEHLFLGTQADNIKDMDNKGRRRNMYGACRTNIQNLSLTGV